MHENITALPAPEPASWLVLGGAEARWMLSKNTTHSLCPRFYYYRLLHHMGST